MIEKAIAIGILILAYSLIISNIVHRTTAAFLGALLVVVTGLMKEFEIIEFIPWAAIVLIFTMFMLVDALRVSGFFNWISIYALRISKLNIIKLYIIFSCLSAFLAAFIDSITVMIFMASLTIAACKRLGVTPVPLIIGEIMSANIGGSATMVGDPPNILIGTALKLTFTDFLINTAPIAMVVFFVNLLLVYLFYKKFFKHRIGDRTTAYLMLLQLKDPHKEVSDWRLLWIALICFVFTITLLILHATLNITIALVGLCGVTLLLLLGSSKTQNIIQEIDWRTILFFASLFVIVGGLEKTGVLADMANGIAAVSGDNLFIILTLILWIAVWSSMLVDNVPFAATMIPVIKSLSANYPIEPMAYSLALGCDIGGNGTPIGASANVVGLAVAEKEKVHIGWKEFCKVAIPITVIVTIIINLYLLRYVI
jgi:Na+/H+ antiporter NhaD/arsenite permease-like protein